jgi:glycine oxidase
VKTYDVAVVGGGLIGVSAAFELALQRLKVVVLDRQEPGREASWAAAGMLAPGLDAPEASALVPLAKESLRLYPAFVAAIEEASRKSGGFAREGTLEVFFGVRGATERDAFVAEHKRLGLAAEVVSLQAAREMEPALGHNAAAAAWLPDEATVDPRLLMDAAITAAKARGVEVRANCGVSELIRQGERCAGVMAGGERIAARHVVITAGCFSGQMGGEIARYAPTRPVRGQMVSLRKAGVKLRRVLRSANGYLVPRASGHIVAGSTLENAGFEKSVTPEGMQKIMRAATELAPALSAAKAVEKWAGLRPGTTDNLPILGPTDVPALSVATGHYRNGILLAAVTAKLVAAWIIGEKPEMDLGSFSPRRFVGGPQKPACRRAGKEGQVKG